MSDIQENQTAAEECEEQVLVTTSHKNKKYNLSLPCDENMKRCRRCFLPCDKNEFVIQFKYNTKESNECFKCREENRKYRNEKYYKENTEKLKQMSKESKIKTNYKYERKITRCELCDREMLNIDVHNKTKLHLKMIQLKKNIIESLNK